MSRAARIEVSAVRLAVTFLGLDLLSIEISTDTETGDCSRDLSGAYLGSDRIDAGTTDCFLGFTNGREVDE